MYSTNSQPNLGEVYFAMWFSPYMVGKLVCMYIITQIPARHEFWCPLYRVFCYLHYNVKSFNRYQHYLFQGVSEHQFQYSLHEVQSSSSSSELAAPVALQTLTHTFNLNLTRDQYADLIESLQLSQSASSKSTAFPRCSRKTNRCTTC